MNKKLIYIASPYTDEEAHIITKRYEDVMVTTAKIIDELPHIVPFSPIVYSHLINKICQKPVSWYEFDMVLLNRCDQLLVLQLDGWKSSYGVGLERGEAMRKGIPIVYATPDNVIEVLTEEVIYET